MNKVFQFNNYWCVNQNNQVLVYILPHHYFVINFVKTQLILQKMYH